MSPLSVTIAIDQGNSSVKAGLFHQNELRRHLTTEGEDWGAILDWVTNHDSVRIIYSTVANEPPESFSTACVGLGARLYAVDRQRLSFKSVYRSVNTLGEDRIGAVAGAVVADELPALVVDAGSCITSDLVDAAGVHRGGNISPGVRMRLRAMAEFTARLPLVPPEADAGGLLGLNTEEAVAKGGITAAALELEALYARLLPRHPGLRFLLTGGDALALAERIRPVVHHDPHLVLRGLNQLLSIYDE